MTQLHRLLHRLFSPMRHWLGAIVVAMAATTPLPAAAQLASLIADRVQVLGNSGLVAEGNVVVIYQDVRLTASRIHYDHSTGQLIVDGPITLTDASGTILIADAAALSSDLQTGLLQSARMVLDQQLQIAATEINRVGGRYTQMTKVVASSCQVCADNPVPIWSIRAARVIHDQEERQLYFHDAQLRIMDVPVMYLPRLRLPDPTVRRATGFLEPTIRSNSQIGTGIRLPYFIRMGDHADLTFSPFISAVTATLEARYRQLFRAGEITFNGAISRDSIRPGQARYFLLGSGRFDLPLDMLLRFNIEQVSDPAYLSDYSFSGKDRLRNDIGITRTRRDQYFFAELGRWETLRAAELPIADQLPALQSDMFFEQRLQPGLIGGELRLQASAQAHWRQSSLDVLGRDQARLGAGLEWQRDWVLPYGLVASAETALAIDRFRIREDTNFAPNQVRITQGAAVALAWPLARQAANGATDVLEPIVQLAWSGQSGPDAPNEDSLMVEFDTANLFDLSRFPGFDAVETGLRANLGLTWTRHHPDGLSFTLGAGKVLRLADQGQFSAASGLDGIRSDWLLAGQVRLGDNLFAQSRALISDQFRLTKAETLVGWHAGRLKLSGGHVWVIADATENRPDATHELTLETGYRFTQSWSASFDSHFDLQARRTTKAGLGIEFRNECISIDLSLSRRFTSSGIVAPTTDIGFGVTLTGFGSGSRGPARNCSG